MRTERIADTDVRFRRTGAGGAALVFVHGFLDDQYVWDGVIAELGSEDVETVQLDLAGMGERTDARGPFAVHVAPSLPTTVTDLPPDLARRVWSPISATLITGERDAVLVDAVMTSGQAAALAECAPATGKHPPMVYVTPRHAAHQP